MHCLGHLLSGCVALPWLLGVDGEQDHLRLELLQPLRVQLQRLPILFLRFTYFQLMPAIIEILDECGHFIPATVININANSPPGKLLAQTRNLKKSRSICIRISLQKGMDFCQYIVNPLIKQLPTSFLPSGAHGLFGHNTPQQLWRIRHLRPCAPLIRDPDSGLYWYH